LIFKGNILCSICTRLYGSRHVLFFLNKMIKTGDIKFSQLDSKTKNDGLNITQWDDLENLN